jgi:hypothetical protein
MKVQEDTRQTHGTYYKQSADGPTAMTAMAAAFNCIAAALIEHQRETPILLKGFSFSALKLFSNRHQ